MASVAQAHTPEGRLVVLDEIQWGYILFGHEEMADHLEAIEETIAHPDYREPDSEVAGRERFFRRNVGPDRWLRVVVEFSGDYDWVVTAYGQENDPPGMRQP